MRFLLLLLISLGILFANPYKNLTHYRLKNGLEVYLFPDQKAKNVQIEVAVKVGMKAEDKKHAGISHLVEHMVFRDSRVKYRDYYDLIKEKGASYVNGYTSYYQTQYVTTINPQNAYWIVKTFSQMLFDKNVSEEDLRVEKGALQIEIGEPDWTDIFEKIKIGKFFEVIGELFPPAYELYEDDFGIDTKRDKIEYHDNALYKQNNKQFTLASVMKHYHDYYFPSNMTLKVVGKFDLKKMQNVIEKHFGNIQNYKGKSVKEPIYKDATLNDAPYTSHENSGVFNSGQISLGVKLLSNDPRKMVVIKSYMENLADRLNREFRNKKGESYSIYGSVHSYDNAALATIDFQTPHAVFDKNLDIAQTWLQKETSGYINDTVIKDAIKQKLKHFESVEHDTDSLLSTLNSYEAYLLFYGKEMKKRPYDFIKEITPAAYKSILKETFLPQNAYRLIQRDYVWFPYEGMIFGIIDMVIFLYLFVRFFKIKIKKRDVKLHRRISSIWTIIIVSSLAMLISMLLGEWLSYGVSKVFGVHSLYAYFDIPLSYLIMIGDFTLSVLILYVVVKKLFSWFYYQLVVTDKALVLVGSQSKTISLEDIVSCKVVPWSQKFGKNVYGVALLFWRPLLKITDIKGENFYIRSFKSRELKEDLAQFINC